MNWMTSLDTLILTESSVNETCQALRFVTNQLANQPELAACLLERLFHRQASGFLKRLEAKEINEEFLLSALKCIDDTLDCVEDVHVRDKPNQIEACEAIGETLLQLSYQACKDVSLATKNPTLGALTILTILNKVAAYCPNYAEKHIAELLGIAKAHVNYGLQQTVEKPQKVQPSQKLPVDSTDELDVDGTPEMQSAPKGGKVSKKRKPRSLTTKSQMQKSEIEKPQRWRALDLDNINTTNDLRTSDSDAAAAEVSGQQQTTNAKQRQNCAKVRQAAINLMGVLATKIKNRRILYAYWHGFFGNNDEYNATISSVGSSRRRRRCDLLHIALSDPNGRCRCLALQISAQLIFNSKTFLQQAECLQQRSPATFTHFAHDLGLQVLAFYGELTSLLKHESSLAVMTQALKCTACLVQVTTPFKKFQPRDFVLELVDVIRALTSHHDGTVQVAALMVMEFLIASAELTPEIAQAIGMPPTTLLNNEQRVNNEMAADLLEIDDSFAEAIESDDCCGIEEAEEANTVIANTAHGSERSWLLQCTLRNLCDDEAAAAVTVRLECMQLLAAMSQHFNLLHTHMPVVANCIEKCLKSSSMDLRLCGARTLDTIAHQIARTLLEATTAKMHKKQLELLEVECLEFWARLLPALIKQITAADMPSTETCLRVSLCDALSNIGMIIFERQPFTMQMHLIGFLSGIANDASEEVSLRSAAVRALAVFVLFPSMRDNLVFVENLAESALRLTTDSSLLVRIKAFWALANISDAILMRQNSSEQATTNHHHHQERLSAELLWRLIAAAINGCSDNDKVRFSAVRALGTLLRLLSPRHFEPPFTDGQLKFAAAITKLIDCLRLAGSAKVKWNACYAIGNLLENSTLYTDDRLQPFDWQSKLFPLLANVIVHHNYFKVRINATNALTHVGQRAHFGVYFDAICKALFDAMEQSQHLDNFYEYNHRDQLQEQLCLALCHLLQLSMPNDFLIFRKYLELDTRADNMRSIHVRVLNRMVPEKARGILACTAHLQQQLEGKDSKLSSEHKNAIQLILKTFDNN